MLNEKKQNVLPALLLSVSIAASLLFPGVGAALAADSVAATRTGVVVTPKNVPEQSAEDVADMFRLNAELGSFTVMRVNWNDPNRRETAQAMMGLAGLRNLVPVIELTAFTTDGLIGASLAPPADVIDAAGANVSFANAAVTEAFSRHVLELADLKPAYLAVATDVNLLHLSDPGEYLAFAAVFRSLHAQIKQRSPDTKVYVSFQWDAMQALDAEAKSTLVNAFRPGLDLIAMNSDPRRIFGVLGPKFISNAYYSRISTLVSGTEPVFVKLSWPSEGSSGELIQEAFIGEVPRLMASLNPSMMAWDFLHDYNVLQGPTARLGLVASDGTHKPSFAAFRALGNDRPPAQFAIFTAVKGGSGIKVLVSNPDREMSHPRVAPDRSRIVLTRYNRRGSDGKATEAQGYEDTEILLVNADGSGLETIVPFLPGIVAANASWTPDGNSLIYISTDNAQRTPEIRQIDLVTRQVTRVPTPAGLKASDPHWEAGRIVFAVKGEKSKIPGELWTTNIEGGEVADSLWLMNEDGSGARQITRPVRTNSDPGLYGDFDPKLSPDGTKVAFMRIDGGNSWTVMVLDLASGEEKLLTPDGPMEWLPTWASDSTLLLYVHIDIDNLQEIGLYTTSPDGANRNIVPLPRGFLYGHSSFFPGDGSSDSARIIFTGIPMPGL